MDQLIACLAIVSFVVVLFVLGDRLLGRDRRRELGGWLIAELPADARVDSLPKGFIEWFDRMFRSRAVRVFGVELHLPSFWRSALASFLALVAAFVVWLANKGALSQPPSAGTNLSLLLLLYGGATVVTNIVPDYLSLSACSCCPRWSARCCPPICAGPTAWAAASRTSICAASATLGPSTAT